MYFLQYHRPSTCLSIIVSFHFCPSMNMPFQQYALPSVSPSINLSFLQYASPSIRKPVHHKSGDLPNSQFFILGALVSCSENDDRCQSKLFLNTTFNTNSDIPPVNRHAVSCCRLFFAVVYSLCLFHFL